MSSNSFFSNYIRNTQHLTLEAQSSQSSQWDDDSVLDENILDSALEASIFETSPVDTRRTSMADMIFSPRAQASEWPDFDQELRNFEHQSPNMSAFDNNNFVKMETQFANVGNWSNTDEPSGACTPTGFNAPSDFQAAEFDSINYSSFANPAAFENNQVAPVTVFQPVSNGLSIPSTPMTNDWSAPEHTENRTIASNGVKRMRPGSPLARVHSPLHMRRDGVRKKNTRFEIPAERTLLNIDNLIANSANDSEIKELKQQKRLLRNRQAALDSRQRKKLHTERLEEDKKHHSNLICELTEKIAIMEVREQEIACHEAEIRHERDQMAHHLEYLRMESEEMVRAHTLETAELRKKNAFLERQLMDMQSKLENVSFNTPAGNFSDEFTFDGMPMDTFWDPPSFSDDNDTFMQMPQHTIETPVAEVKNEIKEDQKPPAAPGLLFLLLLFGAFVASKTSTSSALPPIPGALRTASAAVLSNIFEDAGVKSTNIITAGPSNVQMAPSSTVSQHVSDSWAVAKSEQSQMVGLESSLAMLSARLEQPTLQQEEAQLRMLTAAEYNEVNSKDFRREEENTTSQGRRHLQETLNALRGNKDSAADVYTRSLLWDKVDAEVVRRFAAFAALAQQSDSSDNNSGYEVEVI